MSGIALCLAAAVLGIDVGWQPLPGGGVEYIIQIEPGTLESLRPDEAIESRIPAEVRDVRAYKIVVGTQKLRQELPPKLPEPAAAFPLTKTWGTAPDASTTAPATTQSPKPWMLLWAVGLGLCASVIGNVYLGWIFWGVRKSYRAITGVDSPDRPTGRAMVEQDSDDEEDPNE